MTLGVLHHLFPSSVDDSNQLLRPGLLCVHMRTLQKPPCGNSCWVVVGLLLVLLDQRLCWKIYMEGERGGRCFLCYLGGCF